jgi:hypothetical protein
VVSLAIADARKIAANHKHASVRGWKSSVGSISMGAVEKHSVPKLSIIIIL